MMKTQPETKHEAVSIRDGIHNQQKIDLERLRKFWKALGDFNHQTPGVLDLRDIADLDAAIIAANSMDSGDAARRGLIDALDRLIGRL